MDLSDAYANAAHIPDAASYPPRWAAQAAQFRDALPEGRKTLGIRYGDDRREALDLFLPDAEAAGTLIFVHGGYWMKFGREDWSHLAAGALARGWAVVMPSYPLCPQVGVARITQSIAQAVTYTVRRVPGPVHLAGHSAGGHLVARMLAPGMLGPDILARIERVMPISPLADLRPLMRTNLNDTLHLTLDEARGESPLFQPAPDCPVTVWVGAAERPAFVDQARWLAGAWECDLVEDAGRHHFDVIDGLAQPGSAITGALLG